MNKIRIEELSVGDWVQARLCKWDYDDADLTPPMRVVAISKDCVDLSFDANTPTIHSVFVEDIRPIELTPEVLKQIGCQQIWKYRGQLKFNHEDFFADKRSDGGWDIVGNVWSIRATYLHELQHALRLAGIEREISLSNE